MASMYEMLMQLPVFQGVSSDQMTHILEVTRFEFKTFREGEVICNSGDYCRGVTFLLSGRLKMVTPVFNNRMHITQVFEAPYTFSMHHLFGADLNAHSTLKAHSDRTGVMLLPKTDFLRLMHENEVPLINVMNMLCTRAQKQHRAIDFSGQNDPVLRLASWILAFTDKGARQVSVEATTRDWCEMLGLDEPAFWRCVAAMEGQHIIEAVNGRLKLLDRYALRRLVSAKTEQNQ